MKSRLNEYRRLKAQIIKEATCDGKTVFKTLKSWLKCFKTAYSRKMKQLIIKIAFK